MPARPMYYKLIGRLVAPCSLEEWAVSFQQNQRVASTMIGEYHVSTVFLGLDHNFSPTGEEPTVFETMVFDEHGDMNYQTRCSTYDQAELMHEGACAEVRDWIQRAQNSVRQVMPAAEKPS